MKGVRITHIGGPTALIEVHGWRLLTDPTFDPSGRRYSFGWGAMSRKLAGPAIAASDLGPIDAVLLSHDHHGDNLDTAGRQLLPSAGAVVTTVPGAKRLGGNARGLAPWATTRLEASGRPSIEVTATPCRHGPSLSRPIAGEVVGFALRWDGQEDGVLWISGDTVLYDGVRQVADRVQVDTALLHLGSVRFPVTGPVRYSMTAQEAVELCRLVHPRTAIPVHYEGWKHFRQGRETIEREFARAPEEVRRSIRWLPIGVQVAVRVPRRAPNRAPNRSSGMPTHPRRLAVAASLIAAGLFVASCGGEPVARDATDAPASRTSATASGTATESDPAATTTASASTGQGRGGLVVTTAASDFGPMLFDRTGQAIYLFDKETTDRAECYDACAKAWPPVLTRGSPRGAGAARADLLGTTERTDGSTQVTYAGQPLYYYAHEGPKQVLCHDVTEFGGRWLVVTPDGGTPAA